MYYPQSRYYNPKTGRFLNADGFAATGQGQLGNNMFLYCCNDPVFYCDSSGTRAVPAYRAEMSGGKRNVTYYSDGHGKSDDLLGQIKSAVDVSAEYDDFLISVYHQGRMLKTTDHSLDYANTILLNCVTVPIGSVSTTAGIIYGMASVGYTLMTIGVNPSFPDGYYDTYTVTVSWRDSYEWDGGITYTNYSYEFVVCWDTVSDVLPNWKIAKTNDNSYSMVVYN